MSDGVHVELQYPRNGGALSQVRVSLVDVRAADDIVIRYDFDRDGWAIHQNRVIEREWGMEVVEENREVAFIPAWNTVTAPLDPLPWVEPNGYRHARFDEGVSMFTGIMFAPREGYSQEEGDYDE